MATRSLGQLTIDLIARIAGFEQGMDKAARTADKQFRRMEARAVAFGTAVGNIASQGLNLLGRGLLSIANNTIKSEQQLAQLDAILRSTGNAAGYSRDQLISMAEGLQRVSTFATGEIIEAQTRLLSYSGIVGENIPRAMQAVIDQSARLEMSLTQSAEVIGRALESPSKAAAALAQQGFGAAFTKEVRASIDALVAAGREGEAQIKILEILEESYGGAAEAARDTFGGALKALKNTLGDLLSGDDESLNGLTDAINELIKTLNDPDVRKGFQLIVNGATEGATAVARLTSEFAKAVSRYREWLADAGRLPADMLDSIDQLEVRIRKLAQMQYGGGLLNDLRRAIFGDAIGEELRKAVARRNLLARYPNGLPDFSNVTTGSTPSGGGGGGGGGGGKAGKSEEEKEAERLQRAYESLMYSMRERIALFNAEGEAAKVAYDLEHGALKALDDAKKQELLTEAQRYDALVKRREADEAAYRLAQEETRRIQEGLKYGKQVVSDLQFELELMRMTNAERATAIQLRGMEAEAVAEYGDAIRELNRVIEQEMENARFLDGVRSEFSGFITDVVTGTESIKDAFKSMLDNIAAMITQRIAENWVEQLFGGFGTTQTGSGGGWISTIAGLFAGGRSSGGWIGAGKFAEVNERGIEMATVRGRDYLLTGGAPVEITPNHRIGVGSGGNITQNFYNPVMSNIQTDQQRAREEARKAQRATARLA